MACTPMARPRYSGTYATTCTRVQLRGVARNARESCMVACCAEGLTLANVAEHARFQDPRDPNGCTAGLTQYMCDQWPCVPRRGSGNRQPACAPNGGSQPRIRRTSNVSDRWRHRQHQRCGPAHAQAVRQLQAVDELDGMHQHRRSTNGIH